MNSLTTRRITPLIALVCLSICFASIANAEDTAVAAAEIEQIAAAELKSAAKRAPAAPPAKTEATLVNHPLRTRFLIGLPRSVEFQVFSLSNPNRVIVDLIESGLDAREREKERFFDLADRLAGSRDRQERNRLKEELARMTFGD